MKLTGRERSKSRGTIQCRVAKSTGKKLEDWTCIPNAFGKVLNVFHHLVFLPSFIISTYELQILPFICLWPWLEESDLHTVCKPGIHQRKAKLLYNIFGLSSLLHEPTFLKPSIPIHYSFSPHHNLVRIHCLSSVWDVSRLLPFGSAPRPGCVSSQLCRLR